MRVVIQRVRSASVTISGSIYSSIDEGFLILAGIEGEDNEEDVSWLASKICTMRIFSDSDGKMNLDIKQVNGEVLCVSQFTLHASTKKGNRPSFIKAARPEKAISLYEGLNKEIEKIIQKPVKTGVFGEDMQVSLINNGPVTIIIDSKNRE